MGEIEAPSFIEGVVIQPLNQFVDNRGAVLHMLRKDSPLFVEFGEIYFSKVNPQVVKAWKYHSKMTQLFAVPVGMVRFVIFDNREKSTSKGALQVLEIGRENYQLVRIPPRLWYGFMCMSTYPALIANCADLPHSPDEVDQVPSPTSSIPYEW